jgi:hypothetical protein
MSVDDDGHVVDGDGGADVVLFTGGTDRHLFDFHVGRYGDDAAIPVAADE